MTITCSKTNNGVKNERGMWYRITRFVLHLIKASKFTVAVFEANSCFLEVSNF